MNSYDPGTPQATDLPSDSQDEFLSNFALLNAYMGVDHVKFGNTVSFATNANPCVCTSTAHGLTTGNTVYISHFGSLIGDIIRPWNINGGPYTVTVIDADHFSINADASANPPYLLNTGAFASPDIDYGFHTKTFFPNVVPQAPNNSPPLASPYSAYYTKNQRDIAELFFQNGVGAEFEKQMTNNNLKETSNVNGKGFVTPWGMIINFGAVNFPRTLQVFDFPVPFTTEVWSIIGCINARPNIISFWNMNAVGLDKFSMIQITTGAPTFVPGWYFAIGV